MRHPIRNSLFLVSAALVLGAATLTACSGGGGPLRTPGPIDPPDPIDPADTPNPTPSTAGPLAINGIDQIPQYMVKVSKVEMQRMYVIGDAEDPHAADLGQIACQSYVVGTSIHECGGGRDHPASRIRNTDNMIESHSRPDLPYTLLLDRKLAQDYPDDIDVSWFEQEINSMGTVKIAGFSLSINITYPIIGNGDKPYLIVASAENQRTDDSWYRYSNDGDGFTPAQKVGIDRAIANHKLIVVAGYYRTATGEYVRHPESSGCKGLDSACVWAPYDVYDPWKKPDSHTGGTSQSTVNVSAGIASVLAVFPDTTPQNLASFAKACLKRKGEGIETLLDQSGGLGVADFACMGDTVAALSSLPTGGTTNVTINGNAVSLGDRALMPSFAQGQSARYLAGQDGEEQPRLSFRVVPNGGREVMALGVVREGAFFASVGAGQYDSFFGYSRGHGMVSGIEYAVGHENVFLHLSDVTSRGGDLVSRAEGRSLGLMAERAFRPAEHLAVTLSVNLDKFLGGEADIPFGRVELDEGQWNRRLGLAAEYTAYGGTKLGLNAGALFPNGEKPETHVGFRLHRTF